MNRTRPDLSPEETARMIRDLGPWFHNMSLNGVMTAPDHFLGDYPGMKWKAFAHAIPEDLSGKTVLDVGCNAGFYSMEMKKRGASRVLGIDSDGYYLSQARFAAGVLGLDIEFKNISVYEVGSLGERFDLVLFMGVLYHLRHPLLALDLLSEFAVGDMLVFQSMLRGSPKVDELDGDYPFSEKKIFESPGFPKMFFVEREYSGDDTNWWIPNRACAEAMLRSSGFEILSNPEKEVFICRKKRTGGVEWSNP